VMNPTIGRLPASIVATDPGHDLARLQIQIKGKSPSEFPIIKIADRAPNEGENVFLYGSALFRHWITIKGSMARSEPSYEYISTLNMYCRFSIIAAPSPKGTSGGCWVDSKGQVIGNQSGFINDNAKNPSGLAIVSPIDAVRAILKKSGDGKIGTIGCGLEEIFSQSSGFLKRLPEGAMGLFTVPIRKGSTASEAGLTKETLITHINGSPVTYRRDFMSIFRKVTPGGEVVLRVLTPENHTPRDLVVPTRIISRPAEN